MRKIVTGASGYIGQVLTRALIADGSEVVALSRTPRDVTCEGISWQMYPVDTSEWLSLLDGADTVFHLAWSTVPATSNESPVKDVVENIAPTIAMLEAIRLCAEPPHVVFSSSGGTVYGVLANDAAQEDQLTKPISAYGISKLAVEGYLRSYFYNYGVSSISVRISNPFGIAGDSSTRFGAIPAFVKAGLQSQSVRIFGDGSIVRDYVYIDDVVEALVLAGKYRGKCEIFNVGSGKGTSLNDLVRYISLVLSRKIEIEYIPVRQFDVPYSVLDVQKISRTLGWSPKVSLEDGVSKMLSHIVGWHED
ncbi:NAD-dependent epimerase/dehydratase family protein [Roseibium litorale]|uniref:NAD-dependent epimerase/dehydratase family protein n=1 Tax=Roseibium litorale TaxID=2803841 RepID=A0ABR9CNL8_9HYPH|nr:NAD-dependent epimerase/dehydratase family protein [Roseibium litorale]MBD8892474.1 NAD-dependent epimerase/dehydratase family protein [Roseibium litorale]